MVERYVIEPLPFDALVDGNINNLEAVSAAIESAWKKLGTRVKNCSVALPSSAAIPKKIMLPSGLRDYELEAQVEAEANQYIPFPLDEANLDFQVLGPSPSNPDEIEVLLAASRKANVEDRVASAQAAGLKTIVVDVETYAAEAAFAQVSTQLPNRGVDQYIALVDIGAHVMSVNVMFNGESIFHRDHKVGGAQLTEQIQHTYSLSLEQAEHAKRYGGLADSYENDLLTPFRENVATQIYSALHYFFTSMPNQFNEVNFIVLSGGSAALPGLDDAIASRTQVSTLVANPFANMTLSSRIKPQQLRTDAPALMVACGLAMRRFDPS